MHRYLLPLLMTGCFQERFESGASEPIRIREGTFHEGELPEGTEAPLVINAASVGVLVMQGQGSIEYTGLASKTAYSVAVAFPTMGTGYWTVPVEGPDVTQDDNLLFHLTADFSPEVPYGLQTVSFVALDGNGDPGPRYDAVVCILPESASGNLSACDPEVAPLGAVISLAWDTEVDLDLVVVAPNGKVVSAKAPTTGISETQATIPSEVVNDPATGRLSRDSNSNCDLDSIRLESLVFPGDPPPGEYLVYASLYSACGRSYVNFALSLSRRVDAGDGTFPVEHEDLLGGQLLAIHQNGGATLGTLLTAITLP